MPAARSAEQRRYMVELEESGVCIFCPEHVEQYHREPIEHRGEHFTIIRRGKAVAHLEPMGRGRGADVKSALRRHCVDGGWSRDLESDRELIEIDDRE